MHIKYNKIKNKILVNCLKLGKNPKFTNKKLTQYIYGTRNNVELFNVTELQYIMYRIYPFIKTLFNNYRLNYLNVKLNRKKKKSNPIFNKLETFSMNRNNSEKNQETLISWRKNTYSKNLCKIPPIQILFATTTLLYENILTNAAKTAQMPSHKGRWLSGSLTAKSAYITDIQMWRPFIDINVKRFKFFFHNKHNKNSSSISYRQVLATNWKENRHPALIIIPDVDKSQMIIKESKNTGIPIIGLTNTDQLLIVDYPLLGNSNSIFLVNFFCHFLANLIAKQTISNRHNWFNSNLVYETWQKKETHNEKFNMDSTRSLIHSNKEINYHFWKKWKNTHFLKKTRTRTKNFFWDKHKLYGIFQERAENNLKNSLFETIDYKIKRQQITRQLLLLFFKLNIYQKTDFIRQYPFVYSFLIKNTYNKIKLNTLKNSEKSNELRIKPIFFNYLVHSKRNFNYVLFQRTLQKTWEIKRNQRIFLSWNNSYYWHKLEKLDTKIYTLRNLNWLDFFFKKKIIQKWLEKWNFRRFNYKRFLKWKSYQKKNKKKKNKKNRYHTHKYQQKIVLKLS